LRPLLLLALLILPAAAYDGKYADDPRLAAVRAELPARLAAARAEVADLLGVEVPAVEVRLVDAGRDRTGVFADSRDGVITLRTEYLVLGAFEVDRTLVHETFHCLQRARLGKRYDRVPEWAREGAALYVAGQGPARARALAAAAGGDPFDDDPLARLVNGLGGPHGLFDYYEDAAAFEAVEARAGRPKALALVRRLLETESVDAAVRDTLGEEMAAFEAAAAAHARAVLRPLVEEGRAEFLEARRRMAPDFPEGRGVYAAPARYWRAEALAGAGRDEEALREVQLFLARHRTETVLLGEAVRLEVDLLARLDSPDHAAAAARAALDLTVYEAGDEATR